jgi:hypothetical protein
MRMLLAIIWGCHFYCNRELCDHKRSSRSFLKCEVIL